MESSNLRGVCSFGPRRRLMLCPNMESSNLRGVCSFGPRRRLMLPPKGKWHSPLRDTPKCTHKYVWVQACECMCPCVCMHQSLGLHFSIHTVTLQYRTCWHCTGQWNILYVSIPQLRWLVESTKFSSKAMYHQMIHHHGYGMAVSDAINIASLISPPIQSSILHTPR